MGPIGPVADRPCGVAVRDTRRILSERGYDSHGARIFDLLRDNNNATNFAPFQAPLSRTLFGGEVTRRDRLRFLIIVNFYLLYVTSICITRASAKVGREGDPLSNVAAVVVKPVETDDGRKW